MILKQSKYLFIVFFLLTFLSFAYPADEKNYIKVTGIISVQSNFSDGKYSLARIAELAYEKNIKIVIMADDVLRRWEYGIKPLENLAKKRVEENSVLKMGPEKYLAQIKKVNSSSQGVLIIEGVTAAPFYWWDGSPFRRNLSLNDWHREILVVGLDNPKDYKDMPIVSNASFMPRNLKDIFKVLSPLLIIFFGLLLICKKITRKIIFKDTEFIVPVLFYKRLGYIVVCFGIIFLWNNWNFSTSNFNQYHGDKGLLPYQEFIDYVAKRNGLCFWVHTGGSQVMSVGRVAAYTYKPESILKNTYNYIGFSAIQLVGEVNTAALAGNVWDEVLKQYCQGRKNHPVWAIGELGFQDKEKIDSVQTIFLLKGLSRQAVLDALKDGKMYVKLEYKTNSINLEDFYIQDKNYQNYAVMGDEFSCYGNPLIHITGSFQEPDKIKVDLIRNGKIIQRFSIEESPFEIEFSDESVESGEKTYYRLYIESNSGSKIITNPIFVTCLAH